MLCLYNNLKINKKLGQTKRPNPIKYLKENLEEIVKKSKSYRGGLEIGNAKVIKLGGFGIGQKYDQRHPFGGFSLLEVLADAAEESADDEDEDDEENQAGDDDIPRGRTADFNGVGS